MIPRCLGTRGDAGPRMSSPLYRSVCGGEDEHEVLRLRERDAMHFTMRLQRSLRAEINVIRPRVTWTKMQMIVSCYTARLSSHLYGKDAALSPVETLTVAAAHCHPRAIPSRHMRADGRLPSAALEATC